LSDCAAKSTFDQLAVITGRELTGGKESRGKVMSKSEIFDAAQNYDCNSRNFCYNFRAL